MEYVKEFDLVIEHMSDDDKKILLNICDKLMIIPIDYLTNTIGLNKNDLDFIRYIGVFKK